MRQPDWQYFPLDISLDIDDTDINTTEPTPDGRVSIVDIGEGWHSFEATISPTQVTLTLDLFRDGVINLTRDVNGDIEVGVGATGFDSVVSWDIVPSNLNTEDEFDFDPFTSLRFGVPSGSGGGVTEAVVDNVKLELIDAAVGLDGDFDEDGDVDGNDFLVWQRNPSVGNLADWQSNYGAPPLSANIAAVPEPTSTVLLLLAVAGLAGRSRR